MRRRHERTDLKATWNGTVIAESDDAVVVEGNHYFPESALRREYVTFSNHKTSCAWKGQASYYSLIVNGELNPDAAWYYADPKPEAEMVRGRGNIRRDAADFLALALTGNHSLRRGPVDDSQLSGIIWRRLPGSWPPSRC